MKRFPAPIALLLVGCGLLRGASHPQKMPTLPASAPNASVDVDPRWSPDGKRIAFIRLTPDRHGALWIADRSLNHSRALLKPAILGPDRLYESSRAQYVTPNTIAWSPDGVRIAFEQTEWFTFETREIFPGTGIECLDLSTGTVKPLAGHPTHYTGSYYYYHTPLWSPDGRFLAFIGEGTNGQHSLFVHSLTGQSAQDLAPVFDNYADSDWPAWETGEAALARHVAPCLVYRQGIHRSLNAPPTETIKRLCPGNADRQGYGLFWRLPFGRLKSLIHNSQAPGETAVPRVAQLTWSPDGQRLAFTLTPDASDYKRYEIWTLLRDGTHLQRVSPPVENGFFAPVWIGNHKLGTLSPQGDHFAVGVINLENSSLRYLGTIESADCDWSPDRTQIAFASSISEANIPARTTLQLFSTGLRAD